jgi:polyhydroxyalkanoate depolymerase
MSTSVFDLWCKPWQFAATALEVVIPGPPQWASSNSVVLDLQSLMLRKFSDGRGEPIIVVPPYAGHSSCIADYAPNQSLVQTLIHSTGAPVFCTDWKSASYARRDATIADYLADLASCVDAVGGRANLIGLCQGGWCAAIYAAMNPEKVTSLVIAGAPINTQAGDGVVKKLSNEKPMAFFENLVKLGGGLMSGEFMLAGWKAMHPEKHIPSLQWLDRCKHTGDEEYLENVARFSRWYEHTIDLPGKFYLQAVEWLFKENRLYDGTLMIDGQRANLANINCPVYLIAGTEDDITPPSQVFSAQNKLTGAASVSCDAVPGGHLGLFMGKRSIVEHWPKIAAWICSSISEAKVSSLPIART